jgi:hypothetical protein
MYTIITGFTDIRWVNSEMKYKRRWDNPIMRLFYSRCSRNTINTDQCVHKWIKWTGTYSGGKDGYKRRNIFKSIDKIEVKWLHIGFWGEKANINTAVILWFNTLMSYTEALSCLEVTRPETRAGWSSSNVVSLLDLGAGIPNPDCVSVFLRCFVVLLTVSRRMLLWIPLTSWSGFMTIWE